MDSLIQALFALAILSAIAGIWTVIAAARQAQRLRVRVLEKELQCQNLRVRYAESLERMCRCEPHRYV